ncbi:MAG: trehalose-6-phosphate synthase [Chloroflexi bacterium]|jgi:trehalose 6-phosphate synthase|nr:trehalose-6-phosphate synthase [Chloroflexota bacterium]
MSSQALPRNPAEQDSTICTLEDVQSEFFKDRALIVVSNRGPVTFHPVEGAEEVAEADEDELTYEYGQGGLVTALTGLCHYADVTWIATADTEEDLRWHHGTVPMNGDEIRIKFVEVEPTAYDRYYSMIANPLLWFLQHSMWDVPRAPVINQKTWRAWEDGYVEVNRGFAEAIAEVVREMDAPPLVMLQDYHLYLTAKFLREELSDEAEPTIMHFVHIPWPGPEYWRILPPAMRTAILEGLCSVDIIGLQTQQDKMNFLRTCRALLPQAEARFKRARVWYNNHATHVRYFPISIDVESLLEATESEKVAAERERLERVIGDNQLILRIERIEPSKNVVRGFQAFEEMLELHPMHRGKVKFLALLVPSRLGVDEYESYLEEIMAVVGRINANYGARDWEPIRIMIGHNYLRGVAAMQRYDVLLVNAIADGMNLVAKEGPMVNEKDGVLILSERTGAREQLESGALVISPCDIYATAEALHQALTMEEEERKSNAEHLRWLIEREDISGWLCRQLKTVIDLNL